MQPKRKTAEDLIAERVSAEVEKAFERVLNDRLPELLRQANRKPWMNRDEVIQMTGWSARTLTYLRKKGRISYTQEGRVIMYETASIEALIESGYVPRRSISKPSA